MTTALTTHSQLTSQGLLQSTPSTATLPSRTPAQAAITAYDPALHTLRFDMLAVLHSIQHPTPTLCQPCQHWLYLEVHSAYVVLLTKPPPREAPGSRISRAAIHAPSGLMDFTTTSQPTPTLVKDATAILHFHDPTARDATLDRLFEVLYRPHDDTLNLIQTQIWHCFAGRYTVYDAVAGRSFTEFARTHMQLLTNLTGGRARGSGRVPGCLTGPGEGCFGGPVECEYPFKGVVGSQTGSALEAAERHTDAAVWDVVQAELGDKDGWPEGLRGEEDWLVVLGVLEQTERFRAAMRVLARTGPYRCRARWCARMAETWRTGPEARRAAELAGMETEVDDLEGTKNLLDGISGQLLTRQWLEHNQTLEYGDDMETD
ncbi:uncharacterized protein B0H64DRAFT_461748 [Chaetomium fimeti]|uniref:Uncharacterized protein n=1 Tax=Chaetomium fimeti TaxID=1854472 RepID=A0AAE0LTQ7_9PEZI|nr:hypothetical protein B0H64DRAFT_461748 [Chaetomium fimeti]